MVGFPIHYVQQLALLGGAAVAWLGRGQSLANMIATVTFQLIADLEALLPRVQPLSLAARGR